MYYYHFYGLFHTDTPWNEYFSSEELLSQNDIESIGKEFANDYSGYLCENEAIWLGAKLVSMEEYNENI